MDTPEDEKFAVDRLIRNYWQHNSTDPENPTCLYRIRWKGYTSEHDTVQEAGDIPHHFIRKLKSSRRRYVSKSTYLRHCDSIRRRSNRLQQEQKRALTNKNACWTFCLTPFEAEMFKKSPKPDTGEWPCDVVFICTGVASFYGVDSGTYCMCCGQFVEAGNRLYTDPEHGNGDHHFLELFQLCDSACTAGMCPRRLAYTPLTNPLSASLTNRPPSPLAASMSALLAPRLPLAAPLAVSLAAMPVAPRAAPLAAP
jgi:hypothetical protein